MLLHPDLTTKVPGRNLYVELLRTTGTPPERRMAPLALCRTEALLRRDPRSCKASKQEGRDDKVSSVRRPVVDPQYADHRDEADVDDGCPVEQQPTTLPQGFRAVHPSGSSANAHRSSLWVMTLQPCKMPA